MHNTTVICIPLNTELDDGCDYALQTIAVLEKKYPVFVLVLSQPWSWRDLFALIRREKQLIYQRSNVTYIHPFLLLPFQRLRPIKQLSISFTAWLLKQFLMLRYPAHRKVFWFFEPQQVSQLLPLFRSFDNVFDMVDDFFTQETDEGKRERIIEETTLITVNSRTLFERYKDLHPRVIQVPLGFSVELFARHSLQLRNIQPMSKKMVVGFVGGVNYRLDFSLISELAKRLPEVNFRLVGPLQLTLIEGDWQTTQKVKELFALPNVQHIENQPKSKIPQIIQHFDICMIPYDVRHPFNLYSFPMKVMEYLYLGKPVITTPILELLPLRKHLRVVHTTDDALRAIKYYIRKGWPAQQRVLQRQVTLSQTWNAKVSAICAELVI